MEEPNMHWIFNIGLSMCTKLFLDSNCTFQDTIGTNFAIYSKYDVKQIKVLAKITSFWTITFLLSTLRDWFAKLDAIALQNPGLFSQNLKNQNKIRIQYNDAMCPHQLNDTSVRDASTTPPTTGKREVTTHSVWYLWRLYNNF